MYIDIYLYIIRYLYILLGIPGIFPISQDEGWRMGISQPAKGYGLTMQTFATDLFSLSIETIYLMFWKDVFLLQKHLNRHKQMVFLRCFSIMFGVPVGTFGCETSWFHQWYLCTGPRHVGVVPWCFGLSFDQGEGQVTLMSTVMWPFKTPNDIFFSMEFPYDSGLENGCVLFKHDLHVFNCILLFWHKVCRPMVK